MRIDRLLAGRVLSATMEGAIKGAPVIEPDAVLARVDRPEHRCSLGEEDIDGAGERIGLHLFAGHT